MSVQIRKAYITDLNSIVSCHKSAFPLFFLTLLGPNFLRCFYSSFIESKDAGLLIALESDEIVGFAAYSTVPSIFFGRLKKNRGIALFWYSIPALVRHPVSVTKKLIRGVFYRGDQVQEIHDAALLSSIAVSPKAAGKHIGSKLLAEVENCVTKAGLARIYLTTDLNDNSATLSFYKKNGYHEHSRFIQNDRREMLRLIKDLA